MRRAALLGLLTGCFVDRPPDFDATATVGPTTTPSTSTSATSTTSTTSSTGGAPTGTSTGLDSTGDPITATDATASSTGAGSSSGGAGPPCPNIIYETSFDSPPGFTEFAGAWSTNKGLYATIPQDSASVALLPDFDGDAYFASTVLRLDTPTSTAGLVVHAAGDVTNLTIVLVQVTAGSENLTINGFVNGSPVDYTKFKIPAPQLGAWVELSVSVSQDVVSVALDGDTLGFTYTEVSHGAVGLIAQNGAAVFDEFRVCSP